MAPTWAGPGLLILNRGANLIAFSSSVSKYESMKFLSYQYFRIWLPLSRNCFPRTARQLPILSHYWTGNTDVTQIVIDGKKTETSNYQRSIFPQRPKVEHWNFHPGFWWRQNRGDMDQRNVAWNLDYPEKLSCQMTESWNSAQKPIFSNALQSIWSFYRTTCATCSAPITTKKQTFWKF